MRKASVSAHFGCFLSHRDLHPDQIHQDRSAAGCELSPHVAPAQHLNDGIGIPSGSRETEATLVERSRELGDGSRDVGCGIGRRTSDEERDARIAFRPLLPEGCLWSGARQHQRENDELSPHGGSVASEHVQSFDPRACAAAWRAGICADRTRRRCAGGVPRGRRALSRRVRGGHCRAGIGGRRRGAAAQRRLGAADRRAVLADRRRDAEGRSGAEHGPPQSDRRRRRRRRARPGRRYAGGSRRRAGHVRQVSAGYFAAPHMDLIALFIGSEGTLGVMTEVTLRVLRRRPAMCLALVPFADRRSALAFATRLRETARATWRTRDPRGLDVSAIEHMDARCLAVLREDGADRAHGVAIPETASMALLVTLELPADLTPAAAFDEIGGARESDAPDTPLVRFCRALDEAGVLDRVEISVPGDRAREQQLLALREAVPAGVNARVGRARQQVDARIAKTAADMIVPFARLGDLLTIYDDEFRRRGLDAAVWGHISDGNLHPNVIPRSMADVESGREAILAFGREVLRLGGSPLAEHGVGRNEVKQLLLCEMYGRE